jgi:hypothetical protein
MPSNIIQSSNKYERDIVNGEKEKVPNEILEEDTLWSPIESKPDMSSIKDVNYYKNFFEIHKIISQIKRQEFNIHYKARSLRGKPIVAHSGIYFVYEKGEVFPLGINHHERIVYVGISRNIVKRLNNYCSINFYPPLKVNIEKALYTKTGIIPTADEVNNYVNKNCKHRILFLKTAEEADQWERKIIPALARYSTDFVSGDWLGKHSDISCGIWNDIHKKSSLRVEDTDLFQLSELVNEQLTQEGE